MISSSLRPDTFPEITLVTGKDVLAAEQPRLAVVCNSIFTTKVVQPEPQRGHETTSLAGYKAVESHEVTNASLVSRGPDTDKNRVRALRFALLCLTRVCEN